MSKSTVLSVKNLVLNIGKNRLIDDINFEIKPAEIFALVGESGSGKSLTSLAIMRLLPEVITADSGSIVLQEQNLFELPEYQMQKVRGKQVAMIFQEPMTSLNPVMKVGEQVAEVLKLHLGLNHKLARKRSLNYLKR